MISFQEAYNSVLDTVGSFGEVWVPLAKADGRILAGDITADRDFPPFDRATRDGIAIQLADSGTPKGFTIVGTAAAGTPQVELKKDTDCYEIMTGAILPRGANAVIMYEHLEIKEGVATINRPVTIGQNIHFKGSDEPKGSVVLPKGSRITAAEIGILASVGKSKILVKKNPKVTLFSTGDELVPVDTVPELHQIRQSNSHTLRAALFDLGISSEMVHIKDDKASIKDALQKAMNQSDVLLLSGGVSKGKFDYLPEVLEELNVQKKFHRVLQRPGKPFWFGWHKNSGTTIFGFPGNPTSTFANFHVYFLAWLNKSLGQSNPEIQVFLDEDFENTTDLTLFLRASVGIVSGGLHAKLIDGNGSGDLTSLTHANGFILIEPHQKVEMNEKVRFFRSRIIL